VGGVPPGRDGEDAVDRPDGGGDDAHYYVEDFEDGTLTSEEGRTDRRPLLIDEVAGPIGGSAGAGSGGLRNDLDTCGAYVAEAPEEAATLSAGGHPNSAEPGRKREDDVNLVAYSVTPGDVRYAGPNTLQAEEVDEANSLTASDHKKSERGTLVAGETVAYGIQGDAGSRSGEARKPSVDASGRVRLRDPGLGIGEEESPTVQAAGPPAVAYGMSTEETPKYGEEVSPTLKPPSPSGGGQPGAVAFTKTHGAQDTEDAELWEETEVVRPLDSTAFATGVVVEGDPEVAAPLEASDGHHGYSSPRGDGADNLVVGEDDEARALTAPGGTGKGGSYRLDDQENIVAEPQVFESRFARNDRGAPSDEVPPLKAESGQTGKGDGAPMLVEAPTLTSSWENNGGTGGHDGRDEAVLSVAEARDPAAAVRRLTPTECERLQGFPDGHTLLSDGPTPDGARYAALGDAVTVNVAFWIVRRLIRRRELGLE
jgi:C-5 cytosine-specific DNA methylase